MVARPHGARYRRHPALPSQPGPVPSAVLAAAVSGAGAAIAVVLALVAACPWVFPSPSSASQTAPDVARVYREAIPGVVAVTYREYDSWSRQPSATWEVVAAGLVVDTSGHVLTSDHVVARRGDFGVTLADGGGILPAEVVGRDPADDLAILWIAAPRERLHPLRLRDSDTVHVGEPAIAIGSPFGIDRAVTAGIVSSVGRLVNVAGRPRSVPVIQTDAPTNPGNSGGPLLDGQGQVMGIVTGTAATGDARVGQTSVGVGFAIPANVARQRLPEMIEGGLRMQPWLGAFARSVSTEESRTLGLGDHGGAILTGAVGGEAADRAGLRGESGPERACAPCPPSIPGDVIVAVDGRPVRSPGDVTAYLRDAGKRVGDTLWLGVWREGTLLAVEVRLRARDEAYSDSSTII